MSNDSSPEGVASAGSVSYEQAIAESAPLITLLSVVSVVGYYYEPTGRRLVVFLFGSLAVLTNRVYYQKSLDLRDRLR